MTHVEDDTIRIEEAGCLFEIFGPAADGMRPVAISRAGGVVDGGEVVSLDAAGRFVDGWLSANVPADAPGRFAGFRWQLWCHEERIVKEGEVLTRGGLLELFEDGTMPSPEDFADLLECSGDRVLELRDGAGNLLLDRRASAKAFLTRLATEHLDVLDAPMETPGPGRW